MKTAFLLIVFLAGLALCALASQTGPLESEEGEMKFFKIWPIGKVKKKGKAVITDTPILTKGAKCSNMQ